MKYSMDMISRIMYTKDNSIKTSQAVSKLCEDSSINTIRNANEDSSRHNDDDTPPCVVSHGAKIKQLNQIIANQEEDIAALHARISALNQVITTKTGSINALQALVTKLVGIICT